MISSAFNCIQHCNFSNICQHMPCMSSAGKYWIWSANRMKRGWDSQCSYWWDTPDVILNETRGANGCVENNSSELLYAHKLWAACLPNDILSHSLFQNVSNMFPRRTAITSFDVTISPHATISLSVAEELKELEEPSEECKCCGFPFYILYHMYAWNLQEAGVGSVWDCSVISNHFPWRVISTVADWAHPVITLLTLATQFHISRYHESSFWASCNQTQQFSSH